MQKHINLVDLVKSVPTNICLQNLASIQKRTSPIKFADLAEKSENCSISNLSTKVDDAPAANVLFPGADCYLRVRLGASEIKTEVDKRSHAPVWAMTCELQVDVAHAQEVRKMHFICLLCIH